MKAKVALFLLFISAISKTSESFQANNNHIRLQTQQSRFQNSPQPAADAAAKSWRIKSIADSIRARHRGHPQAARINGASKKASKKVSSDIDATQNYNFIGLTTKQEVSSYVPSGLNQEQYEQIKRGEAAKLAKMNFGAWGPRFKRAAAPDGDWMVQTNLWVRGCVSSHPQQQQQGVAITEAQVQRRESRRRQLATLRTTMASFVLAYFALEIILLSSFAIRSGSATTQTVLSSILAARQGGILHAMRGLSIGSSFIVLSKVQMLKLAIAGVAAPFLNQYREIANRRWLWSKRRIFGSPITAAVGILFIKILLTMGLPVALR